MVPIRREERGLMDRLTPLLVGVVAALVALLFPKRHLQFRRAVRPHGPQQSGGEPSYSQSPPSSGGVLQRLSRRALGQDQVVGSPMLLRVISLLVGLLGSALLRAILPAEIPTAVSLLPVAASFLGPSWNDRRRLRRRRKAMARDFPRILDLLALSVEAGMGFEQAISRVVQALPGALSAEFIRMQAEIAAGAPRSLALRSMADRCPLPEIRTFVVTLVQAETFGVPVGPLLRSHADDVRIRHRQAIQLRAQKAPVKMLIPLVLCVFPSLLVVVAGPALLTIRQTLLP